MVANLGFGSLFITFVISLYGAGAAVYGSRKHLPAWVDSARNAMLLTFPLLSITAISIIYLLVTGHYEFPFVNEVISNSMPISLRITALWGGQAGSLIFWSWLMSAFAAAVTLRKWERDREFLPWVILVSLVTLAFFLMLSIFVENPFIRLWQSATGSITSAFLQPAGMTLYIPPDGSGMNPLLRHFGMIIHPPLLYLGFVSFVIPYAFAMAALITRRSDDRWIRITRRWTLVAWLFLSLGLLLGGRWSYDVLGWGGYWNWDPVETASFMPWVTGTAFLHSVMIQEKRRMLKQWNMVLIILTYDLVIFGTFLTRSGVLDSVHAFAQSAIGPLFFAFIVLTLGASLALLLDRWNDLKSDTEMKSWFSREGLFLLNNLLFLGLAIVCFWGVLFPVLSEALGIVGQKIPALAGIFTGQKVAVRTDYYNRATAPLFAGLLLLMAIAPLTTWKLSTHKTIGKTIWKPFAASLVVPPILLVGGMRSSIAIVGFWLCTFVTFVTLNEIRRAAWARHKSTGENLLHSFWNLAGKNRRRYGGYAIHLAMVLMAVGIIGTKVFQTETQATIPQGGQIILGQYTVHFNSLSAFDTPDGRNVARAVVSVYKNGKYVGELYPRRDYYYESQQPVTIPGVRSTMEDDLYIILADWQPLSTAGATFKVYDNPLIDWLWLGGFVFVIGMLVAAWPEKDPELVAIRRSVPVTRETGLDHDS
ncbi:MAG TPA: cytochrome c-type biogenesis CcmF C-terminal domain-containing protein [Anaerolineales bacterium]|nr:cytochrome c-type biogenesis CcmF C-terminal domain-containing protein [Anaerolineales bacterium]